MEQSQHDQLSVAFHTLGCKVNQHDSDVLAAQFVENGYQIVDFQEEADVYVINTCTVTHLSDRKSRQMIRRAIERNNDAIVVVCGCYAQTSAEEIAKIAGVSIVIGTNERNQMIERIERYRQDQTQAIYLPQSDQLTEFEPVLQGRVSDMTRAYVKIQEGCNQYCTYCIIPYARGPLRSRKVNETIEEINELVQTGYKEIILTGIHVGAYGKGKNDDDCDLHQLCERILNETTIERIRLGSIECTEITSALIELIKTNPRMARHLHIPLQSGSDTTLLAMNRPYNSEDFRNVVRQVRSNIPGIAITTDVMIGFPGESDDDHRESLIFSNDLAFSDMHIFKYSPREGTPAARMSEQVASKEKDRRAKLMAEVAKKNMRLYQKANVGKVMDVLIEEEISENLYFARASNYLRVHAQGSFTRGEMVGVQIETIVSDVPLAIPVELNES